MSVDEFFVLFQIIQNFSVTNLKKDFDISKLYTSKLNGTQKKKIQDHVLFPLQN